MQHDCVEGQCKITRTKRIRQERDKESDSELLIDEVKHSHKQKYVLNLAQMRDAAELMPLRCYPPDLEARENIIYRAAMQEVGTRSQRHHPTHNMSTSQPPATHTPSAAITGYWNPPASCPQPALPSTESSGNSLFRTALLSSYRQPYYATDTPVSVAPTATTSQSFMSSNMQF